MGVKGLSGHGHPLLSPKASKNVFFSTCIEHSPDAGPLK